MVVDVSHVVVRRIPQFDQVTISEIPPEWRCVCAGVVDGESFIGFVLEPVSHRGWWRSFCIVVTVLKAVSRMKRLQSSLRNKLDKRKMAQPLKHKRYFNVR